MVQHHLEIVQDRLDSLEALNEQDDNEEEEEDDKEEEVQLLEKLEREKETERAEQAAEEMVKTFISRSLEVLDDLDNDMKKLRKNACQKGIR